MGELENALASVCPDPQRVRDYYLPVATWLKARIERGADRPRILGISGPQGAGKSTLSEAMVHALSGVGLSGIAISIDDFYLTHAEQRALAARCPNNRFLAYRGYPGTHDVELGRETLASLRAGLPTLVPTYDKSAQGGRGDRAPESGHHRVEGPLDFVILEGWMLGFSPLSLEELSHHLAVGRLDAADAAALRVPNEMLAAYASWHATLEALVRLDPPSLETIVEWRVDAERARRSEGRPALSDDEARDYIERFLPAYEIYLPRLATHPPCEQVLAVSLDASRAGRVAT